MNRDARSAPRASRRAARRTSEDLAPTEAVNRLESQLALFHHVGGDGVFATDQPSSPTTPPMSTGHPPVDGGRTAV
jgi:hypothetical protein